MQYLNLSKIAGLFAGLALFVAGTPTALAVGTASGTIITNTATVDYEVGGDARSDADSDTGFAVDNRVDLTVVNQDAGNNVNVTPAANDQVLEYLVTNTGNTAQGYLFTTDIPTANIPMANVEIYIDDPDSGTVGSWDAGDPLYTPGVTGNFANLFPGGEFAVGATTQAGLDHDNGVGGRTSVTVFIVADTPAAAVDTNQDDVRLVAQTTNSGTDTVTLASGAPNVDPLVVDVVFADGPGTTSDANRDGQHSDAATYTVVSAALTLTKIIAGTTDEFGGAFSIPNADVEYTITVSNTGAGTVDADTISVTDPIPTGTKLCVAAGCGGAPAMNAGTSGLGVAGPEYSTVAAPNECDTGSFTGYVPTADADGADAAITCVRIQPTGTMAVSPSAFTIDLFVVIE